MTIIGAGALGTLFILDIFLDHSPMILYVFYVPLFVEFFILGLGALCLLFGLPEQCCSGKVRFFNVYLCSLLIFTLLFINTIYEAHQIIYRTLKVNSGIYDEDVDDWWKYDNIYKGKFLITKLRHDFSMVDKSHVMNMEAVKDSLPYKLPSSNNPEIVDEVVPFIEDNLY